MKSNKNKEKLYKGKFSTGKKNLPIKKLSDQIMLTLMKLTQESIFHAVSTLHSNLWLQAQSLNISQ